MSLKLNNYHLIAFVVTLHDRIHRMPGDFNFSFWGNFGVNGENEKSK